MSEPVSTDILELPADQRGQRLDRVLPLLYPGLSRSRLVALLRDGNLSLMNSQGAEISASPSMRIQGTERVRLHKIPELIPADVEAQPLDLDVVYQDEDLLVINKPASLVMHPAAGNPDSTVQNGLLHMNESLRDLPRAGIVHRLDKDTTGLFVVACSRRAYSSLVEQLQTRSMSREYTALVYGEMIAGGTIDAPIGRHPRDRLKMAVRQGGKPAITHFRVAEHLGTLTLVDVRLETGRTHQIRVHLASKHHPLVGDRTYGGRRGRPAGFSELVGNMVSEFGHQALHAQRLTLIHPADGRVMTFSAPLPEDFEMLLTAVRAEVVNNDAAE